MTLWVENVAPAVLEHLSGNLFGEPATHLVNNQLLKRYPLSFSEQRVSTKSLVISLLRRRARVLVGGMRVKIG